MPTLPEAELCFPLLVNSSCRKLALPRLQHWLSVFFLSSVSVLTVTLNLLVIISISHFRCFHCSALTPSQVSLLLLLLLLSMKCLLCLLLRQLRTPTNLLLLSLAVSDFLVGLRISLQVAILERCWFLGDLMCAVFITVDYIITGASLWTMVLIAIDRYVAICDPMHYPTKFSQRRVRVHVCVCWAGLSLVQIVLLRDNLTQPGRFNTCAGECVVAQSHAWGLADMLIAFIGPVGVIAVLYLRIFLVVVAQAHAMRSRDATEALAARVRGRKSELKAARNLGAVIAAFLVCTCPYYSVAIMNQNNSISVMIQTYVICLLYFNSCVNPMIYAALYPWFRTSMRLIVTLQVLKPGSRDSSLTQRERGH